MSNPFDLIDTVVKIEGGSRVIGVCLLVFTAQLYGKRLIADQDRGVQLAGFSFQTQAGDDAPQDNGFGVITGRR